MTERSTSTTSSSSEMTTSREVLENVYHINPQPETTSRGANGETSESKSSPSPTTTSDSRSTADVPSEVLVSQEERQSVRDAERVPSAAGYIHNHLLPTGWACNYYPDTDEYRFEFSHQEATPAKSLDRSTQDRGINVRTPTRDETVQTSRRPTLDRFDCKHGYHFPTSPTSSMISELARQVQKASATGPGAQPTAPKTRQVGYGKHKLTLPTEEHEQARRLNEAFPTATMPVIEQLIQIYHGRESLIKAALISLGYKRSTEYSTQQASAQSPIMLMMMKPSSKKLFDKLVSYFPDKDTTLIKSLMYKHKEVEHEVISALVESFQESSGSMSRTTQSQIESALKLDRSGAIMKLRYLKFLYPTCEEIEIYHLLNCNDLNAQKVMEIVESRGHKKANIEEALQNRKSQTQQMRAQQTAYAAKEKACSNAADLVQAHVQRPRPTVAEQRVQNLKANLKKTFEELDEGLAQGALEAADFNESLARKFLEEREPVDESLFKQRYQIQTEVRLDVVAFPCKAIQKDNSNFMSIISNECVQIPREVIECDNALALLKVDATTFTGDDYPTVRTSLARGAQRDLRRGPSVSRQQEMKHRQPLHVGPQMNLKCGTKYAEIMSDPERPKPGTRAMGRNKTLPRGSDSAMRCGRNTKLLERIHPFFTSQA